MRSHRCYGAIPLVHRARNRGNGAGGLAIEAFKPETSARIEASMPVGNVRCIIKVNIRGLIR